MKTKAKIVERLIKEKHITVEEAVVLLVEKQSIGLTQFPSQPIRSDGKVPYHTICGCDVCHCVIGNKMVDPDRSGNFVPNFTYTISTFRDKGETQQEYFGRK